jgi:prophage regulatory protein
MSDPSSTSPSPSESFRSSRLLRLPVVVARVGLSATTIWRLRCCGQFPDPVRISPGCVAWREADVESWIASRLEASVGGDQEAEAGNTDPGGSV